MNKTDAKTEERVVRLYRSGLSGQLVADRVGLDATTVWKILHRRDEPIRLKKPLESGDRFGKLVLVCLDRKERVNGHTVIFWLCTCDCGKQKIARSSSLISGNTKSCGCIWRTRAGRSNKTPEYALWKLAKVRARKKDVPFDIEPTDIFIPKVCPVFSEIRLSVNNDKLSADSATLDRLVSELGYVRGNVRVISWRANCLKRDATSRELREVADWLDSALYPA